MAGLRGAIRKIYSIKQTRLKLIFA